MCLYMYIYIKKSSTNDIDYIAMNVPFLLPNPQVHVVIFCTNHIRRKDNNVNRINLFKFYYPFLFQDIYNQQPAQNYHG